MKTRSIVLVNAISVFFVSNVFSQAPEIEWQNTIGSELWDFLLSVQQTADGGYILGGHTDGNISGDKTENSEGFSDFWIVKTDGTGAIEWQNTIGGSDIDAFGSIIQTSDGGYITGGQSWSEASGDKSEPSWGFADYWIVKLSSNGVIEWEKTIGGNGEDHLFSIIQTADGGYLLGGWSSSGVSGDKTEPAVGSSDYWVVKLSASGVIEWQNTIGGSDSDRLTSVEQTADMGYIIGGWSESGISGDKTEHSHSHDYWIIKLNSAGAIEWQNTIGGSKVDDLQSIQQTSDDGYILFGWSDSKISVDKTEENMGPADYWVVKINSAGIIEWENTIGGINSDYLYAGQQTTDGGYILFGWSDSPVSGDKTEGNMGIDYWVVKLTNTGSIEWQNTIGGDLDDVSRSLQQTSDGGFILGGWSFSDISDDKTENSLGNGADYWIVKLYPDVCQAPTLLTVKDITFSSSKLIWDEVSGAEGYRVRYKASGTSAWTITSSSYNFKKISALTPETNYAWQVKSICGADPAAGPDWSSKQFFTTNSLKLEANSSTILEVHPNPFTSATALEFSLPNALNVKIELIDLQGRKIKTIAEGNFEAGNHQLNFSDMDLPNGIYLLKLHTNEKTFFTKLIKQ